MGDKLKSGAKDLGIDWPEAQSLLRQHAKVTLETGADVGKRITATRLVLGGGIGGLIFKKTTGHLYLTFKVGDEDVKVAQVPAKREAKARDWVIEFNQRRIGGR